MGRVQKTNNSLLRLKADLASKVEKMRQSILEGVNMNHPPPSALLPSPTFVPPMMPPLYPVSLYSRAMGSFPPPPQARSRGFAGQYLRMRCHLIYFTINHLVPCQLQPQQYNICLTLFEFHLWYNSLKCNSPCILGKKVHWNPRPFSIEVVGSQGFDSHHPNSCSLDWYKTDESLTISLFWSL